MSPAAQLTAALMSVSERVLMPRHERLVVLIDGLDEYDPPVSPRETSYATGPPRLGQTPTRFAMHAVMAGTAVTAR